MAFKANLVVANVPAARKILFAVMVSLRNPSSPLIATLVSLLIILSTINPPDTFDNRILLNNVQKGQ